MAEKTNHPQFDSLIERFASDGLWANPITDEDLLVCELRDSLRAHGMQRAVASAFADYAEAAGFNAAAPQLEENPPPSFYYPEIHESFFSEYELVLVQLDEDIFAIDWAAAQFGFSEFPLIQKHDGRQFQRSF